MAGHDDGEPSDDGFSTFFRAEFGAVQRVVELIVGSPAVAQEVTQDAFVEALLRWPKVGRYDRPGAWVRRVAIRQAVRVRDRRLGEPAAAVAQDAGGGPVDLDLRRAVAALPRAQRAAVALFYLEDRPVTAVAELMGCSPATVKVHLHRARQRLAQALTPIEDGHD